MRTSTLFNALSGAAVVAAGVLAMDLGDEMRMGWKYGLLPRQTTQNLQTFEGNLGGVQASAVCDFLSLSLSGYSAPQHPSKSRDPCGRVCLAPRRSSVWRSQSGAVSGVG